MSIRRQTKKDVYIMRPADYRVLPLKVATETDYALITEAIDEVETLVWKHGPGWNKPDGGTMFLALEGLPITTYINEAKEVVSATIEEFLRLLWGDKYDRLQPELREPLDANNYAATVTVIPVEVEEGAKPMLDKVKAAEILKESNLRQLKEFGVSEPEIDKTDLWVNRLLFLLVGAFGMYFLVKQAIV